MNYKLLISFIISAIAILLAIFSKDIINPAKFIYAGEDHNIQWKERVENSQDGKIMAKNMFGVSIIPAKIMTTNKQEFMSQVKNCCINPHATGPGDILLRNEKVKEDSIYYFMSNNCEVDPIMVLSYGKKIYLLDGLHRLCAAFLLNCPIKYQLYYINNISRESALKLPYPYTKYFQTSHALHSAFNHVKNYKLCIKNANYQIKNIPQLTPKDKKYLGKSLIIDLSPNDYHKSSWMSDWFNEKCRLKCKRYDEKYSPKEYWDLNRKLVIQNVADRGSITMQKLHDEMYARVLGCNNFRPTLMSGFIKLFNAKYILDFSSGWGDRLIGALANHVYYVGVDPNPCVHRGYQKIIKEFNCKPEPHLIIDKFQSAKLPDIQFDLIFTSPPYFNLENYSDDENQSINEYQNLDLWFENFLLVSLKKSWDKLKQGGKMVIIINNIRDRHDFVMKMVDNVRNWNDSIYDGLLPYGENSKHGYKSPQPMWIFTKKLI